MAANWGTVDFDWSFILLLILSWYILLRIWENNGTLDRWNASRVFGVILMVRSKRGLKLLDKTVKPRGFWRFYGEISLWVCMFSMIMVGLLMVIAFITALLTPPQSPPPSASELVAIPGLNPVIPLGWGAVAFIVALVIHEFGHGLQARAHGMRIRAFGLLQLGPLPLGAFAEPQYEELTNAPSKERMRMFAAGPATNIFAAIVCLMFLGGLAGQFVATDDGVHVRGIVQEEGAYNAGLEPWDTIQSIDNQTVSNVDDFYDIMTAYSANDTIAITVMHQDGDVETLNATLSDKYDYYLELGWSKSNLADLGVEQGDAFLGVEGLSGGTAGIDRLAGPLSPRWDGNLLQKSVMVPFHTLSMMIVPFELQGVAMHPFEESLLEADDNPFAQTLGTNGLLFLVNLFFWLLWVNILLGFTNLIPMVPFDGGHMFKDMLRGILNGVKKVGRKLKFWDINPMWIEHISSKASNISSLALLGMIVFILIIPYF
ncbi:MAG: site-2 protease family protein [Candidatus Poseidoniaceae archaeon]|tara:strand:- start:3721 stop:5178 length:1458 start_codon:yes stop_codon:yes gene_type:complete